jgi:hypothetical protein
MASGWNVVKLTAERFLLEVVKTRTRLKLPRIEALCIVLARLSSASRWADLELLFGRSRYELSDIGNYTASLRRFGHLLRLSRERF